MDTPTFEASNIASGRTDPVEGLGWSIVLEADTSKEAMDRIKEAWLAVAALGRDQDTTLGDWPSQETIAARLPAWLTSESFADLGFGFDTWCGDLPDRDWIWWSYSRLDDGRVRIDLKAYSMPISDWTLTSIVEVVGARVLRRDLTSIVFGSVV